MPISGGQAPPDPFLEVYDDDIAALAYVTPTVSGVFGVFSRAPGPVPSITITTETYQDGGTMTGWCVFETGVSYVRAVIGEASKIRFQSTAGAARGMVVNRIA